MLPANLRDVTLRDIESLLDDAIPEGKEIDYKRDMYRFNDLEPNRSKQTEEFLKDVSSFANTIGGDLIIGVDEAGGVPTAICGFEEADPDDMKNRLSQLLQTWLEPRIAFSMHSIPHSAGRIILIIRVLQSLVSPHRVIFKKEFGQFYARNSTGAYRMDTSELRRAFTLSDTIYDRVKSFRTERVEAVRLGDTPLSLPDGPKMILHMIPLESFSSRLTFRSSNLVKQLSNLPLLHCSSGWQHRYNLDGIVNYDPFRSVADGAGYTQIFRNGVIESVGASITVHMPNHPHNGKLLHNIYVRGILESVPRFISCMHELDIPAPVWCYLSLVNVKGLQVTPPNCLSAIGHPIDRDILHLPEIEMSSLTVTDFDSLLSPLFDDLWNAAGVEKCPAFTTDGKFRSQNW